MPELGPVMEREMQEIRPAGYSIFDVARKRDRRSRTRRVRTAVFALGIAAVAIGGLLQAFGHIRSEAPAGPGLARNGDITYVGHNRSDMSSLYSVNPAGGAPTRILVVDPTCRRLRSSEWCDVWITSVDWSPDGTRIAYALDDRRAGVGDRAGIYVKAVATEQTHRLTRCSAPCVRQGDVEWSSDGSRIAYTEMDHDFCNMPSGFAGTCSIYTVNADGTDRTRLSTGSVVDPVNPSWAPDGTTIAFSGRVGEEWFVYTMVLDGSDPSQLTPDLPAPEQNLPAWSPDGSTIAFLADGGGTLEEGLPYELWLAAPDGSERRLLTPGCCRVGGGGLPAPAPGWSPDGTKILIHDGSFIRPEVIDVLTGSHVIVRVKAGGAIAWQPEG